MSRRYLPSGLPRGLANHRSEDGRVYRDNGRAIIAQLQLDPRAPDLAPLLQRYCLAAVDEHRLTRAIEAAQQQGQPVLSLLRVKRKTVAQLLILRKHLFEIAPPRVPTSVADVLRLREAARR